MLEGNYAMMIYGLQTCAICQRARKTLEAKGIDVIFRDVRSEPLSEAELSKLIVEFGDRLVDRKSNDYRALNNWLKNSEAEAQIAAQPKVMARPVIRDNDRFFLGWDDGVQEAVLADRCPEFDCTLRQSQLRCLCPRMRPQMELSYGS